MSSHVELCEHHAKDCLQAAEKSEDPLAREMLLGHALEWMRDGLAPSNKGTALVYGAPTRTAANRATVEKCTVPFSRSRPINLRNQRLTGSGVVYRWTAHSPQKTGVQIQPPFARFHTDLAALFKLPHISQRLWLAVYNYVREGTEDIVLCCGRIDCEAQDSRGCQTSACNGHHDCLHPQSKVALSASFLMR